MDKKRFALRIATIVLPLLAMGIAALPNAAVMHFMADPAVGGDHQVYCSFYSGTLIGYGNWFPVLTLLFSAVAAVLCIVECKREYPAYRGVVAVLALLGAATALLSGAGSEMTPVSWAIAAVLVLEAVLSFVDARK